MKTIDLGGQVALVDDPDSALFGAAKWRLAKRKSGLRYAARMVWDKDLKKVRCRLLHREIMGATSGQLVDHRDGDGLNNQRYNLRLCDRRQNNQHVRKRQQSSSIFKGVCKRRDCERWEAYIKVEGKRKHLGLFLSEQSAAKAYDVAAKLVFGEFALLNFNEKI